MARPRPTVTGENRFFWEGAARDQLLLQRCSVCSTLRHPPSVACPQCRSLEWNAAPASGRGEIYGFVVLHPPLVPGLDEGTIVAVVQLAEGLRVVTNIVGVEPGQVEIGTPVELCFEDIDNGMKLPQFRPAAAGQQ
jgi:uncharacterized OB-fold protein